MSLERTLANRFLLSRRRERFLSVASLVAIGGMAFGVAAFLISLSVITGFQKEFKKAILSFNSHLVLMNADEISDPEGVARKALESAASSRTPVKGWTPFIYREGMAVSGSRVKGIVLKGIDFRKFSNLSGMTISFDPELQKRDRIPTLLLGETLARELAPKDRIVRILFPQGANIERDGAKSVRRFSVGGTFVSGLHEYDSSFAFLALSDAERFFKTNGRVSGLEFWLEDPDRAAILAERLKQDFPYPFAVMTWRDLNESIFRVLELEKQVFFLLMIVLVGVAVLNVLVSLLMLLLEKRGEVAILRAMGLPWRRLRKVFLWDGLLIGFVATALGIVLGLGVLFFLEKWQPIELAAEVYFVRNIPVAWTWTNFWWVISSTFLVVFVGCELALRGISGINVPRTLLEKS